MNDQPKIAVGDKLIGVKSGSALSVAKGIHLNSIKIPTCDLAMHSIQQNVINIYRRQ